MAQVTVLPTAIGGRDQWALNGTTKPDAVTDGTDTNYIEEVTNTHKQTFTHPGSPSGAATIDQVDITWRHRTTAQPSSSRPIIESGPSTGVFTNGTTQAHDVAGAWRTDTDTNLARPGGGNWDPGSFNVCEIGVEQVSNSGGNQRCSRLEFTVTFTPSAGGLQLFVAQWAGAVFGVREILGGFLSYSDLYRTIKTLSPRVIPTTREELEMTLEEYHRLQGVTL